MTDSARGSRDARPSLGELAAAAGVSISTASRVMAGRGDLRDETRRRVLTAAEALGYRARPTQGRPSVDTRLIELVIGRIGGGWAESVIIGAQRGAYASGFDLVLTMERDDPDDDWPVRVLRRRPSGVLLASIIPTRRQLEVLTMAQIPLVLLDPTSPPVSPLASVGTTDRRGGFQAGAHLAATGLRRLAMVTGRPQYRFGKEREAGFREALREAGIPAADIGLLAIDGESELDAGLAAMAAADPGPFGVFARDDGLAFEVYRAAERLGLDIPGRISVVGFNDVARAATARPPLTTVRQPVEDIAARAVQLVQELRAGGEPHDRVELPTRLVVRESTRPVLR